MSDLSISVLQQPNSSNVNIWNISLVEYLVLFTTIPITMDEQAKTAGPPAHTHGAPVSGNWIFLRYLLGFHFSKFQCEEGRRISDIDSIDPEKCDAGKAQSEYVPDSNNTMEQALGHVPKPDHPHK